MSNEQLTIDFSMENATPLEQETLYKALDHQLADLMQKLNGESNKTLKECTLEISKNTQEGKIAFACNSQQQKELLLAEVVGGEGDYKPLILDDGYLYLRRYWQYQDQLATLIKSRLEVEALPQNKQEWLQKRLDFYFPSHVQGEEVDWQRLAAERALKQQFLIISGGPGTGKTTTITRILALLIEQYLSDKKDLNNELIKSTKTGGDVLSILLAAPTGKAAVRMLDAIHEAQNTLELPIQIQTLMPTQASTIHKLLGSQHGRLSFKYNQSNPLKADIVIVDEASMIDIALMAKLVEAVPPHAKLILVGDKDQLSSVETGSVFADLCTGLKNSDNLLTLKKNWRFSENSNIGQLAIAVNNGDTQTLTDILQDQTTSDCSLISPEHFFTKKIPHEFIEPWDEYFQTLNNPQASISEIFDAFNQHRILCALRKGSNGSQAISAGIEKALEKRATIKLGKAKNKSWYHGRPIMITQNSYSRGLFNGDTGIALYRNGAMKIYFPDEEKGMFKSLAPVRLPPHQTTWAMTIHKSQGSEFDQVTMVLPHEFMPLLSRQLIYTGITRAKKGINIIASKEVLVAGIKQEAIKATQVESRLINIE